MEGKNKKIVVYYVPSVGQEPDVYETTGRAGYHIHSDENGAVIGYRIYADELTVLIPAANVKKIEAIL